MKKTTALIVGAASAQDFSQGEVQSIQQMMDSGDVNSRLPDYSSSNLGNMEDYTSSQTTFEAVDRCTTYEMRDLNNYVLSYYSEVASQSDESFTSLLTTARLTNAALQYLGAIAAEMDTMKQVQNASSKIHSMLRTCMADAMQLSSSLQKCDLYVTNEMGQTNSVLSSTQDANQDMGSCLSTLCEQYTVWNTSCGAGGLTNDLHRIAGAHELHMHTQQAPQFSFHSQKENFLLGAPSQHATSTDDFAMMYEDLYIQDSAMLDRMQLWLDVQFRGLLALVQKKSNEGYGPTGGDVRTCNSFGFHLDTAQWLRVAFENCDGSPIFRSFKMNEWSKGQMDELVGQIARALPEKAVVHATDGGTDALYAGKLSQVCSRFTNLEPRIVEQVKLFANEMQTSQNIPQTEHIAPVQNLPSQMDEAMQQFQGQPQIKPQETRLPQLPLFSPKPSPQSDFSQPSAHFSPKNKQSPASSLSPRQRIEEHLISNQKSASSKSPVQHADEQPISPEMQKNLMDLIDTDNSPVSDSPVKVEKSNFVASSQSPAKVDIISPQPPQSPSAESMSLDTIFPGSKFQTQNNTHLPQTLNSQTKRLIHTKPRNKKFVAKQLLNSHPQTYDLDDDGEPQMIMMAQPRSLALRSLSSPPTDQKEDKNYIYSKHRVSSDRVVPVANLKKRPYSDAQHEKLQNQVQLALRKLGLGGRHRNL